MTGITRRAFFGASAGAVAGALLRRTAGGHGQGPAGAGPAPPFTLGLASYTFREFDLDATLAMAKRVGLMRLALKDVHLPLESPVEAVRAAAAKVRAAGLALYGCGVVYMTNESEVDRAFDYARSGGMGVVIGVPEHGLLGRVEAKVRGRASGWPSTTTGRATGATRRPDPSWTSSDISIPGSASASTSEHCQRSGVDPSEAAAACGPRTSRRPC